jgi:hypothetical protein
VVGRSAAFAVKRFEGKAQKASKARKQVLRVPRLLIIKVKLTTPIAGKGVCL